MWLKVTGPWTSGAPSRRCCGRKKEYSRIATGMSHIAIQEALDGRAVDWLERVTDEQDNG
jgi:hypothetical protein